MKKVIAILSLPFLFFPMVTFADSVNPAIPTGTIQYDSSGNVIGVLNSPIAPAVSSSSSGLSACQNLNGLSSVASCALGIINLIIPIIVAITVVWTIYSSFELARTEGDDRKKWGWAIFYGLLGIFLMISVYGLVAIFTGTFGFSGSSVTVPNLNNTVQLSQ